MVFQKIPQKNKKSRTIRTQSSREHSYCIIYSNKLLCINGEKILLIILIQEFICVHVKKKDQLRTSTLCETRENASTRK